MSGTPDAVDSTSDQNAASITTDDLLIVDCLLPGQVRQLGTMRYLTARRPVKTTAMDCQIRGGEFVAYDRSNYATALSVWLPQAEQGDPVAQNYVGEIYEKGLGTDPQFDQAAKWFEKSATQGYDRAQINLGYLYEKGLGVPLDPVKALNLYRQATGLDETLTVDQTELITRQQQTVDELKEELTRRQQEMESLRRQLEQTQTEKERIRQQVDRRQRDMESERQAIDRLRAQLAHEKVQMRDDAEPQVSPDLRKLEKELERRQTIIDIQRKEATRLQAEISRIQALEEQASAAESEKLKILAAEFDRQEESLEAQRSEANRLKGEIQALEARKQRVTAETADRLKELETAISERETTLENRRKESEQLSQEIAQLDAQVKKYRERLVQTEKQQAEMAEPAIEIIDPRIMATRGLRIVSKSPGATRRRVIGKVVAPAGVYSFRVNQKVEELENNGLFKVWIPLTRSGNTDVEIVAVDTRGKRADVQFTIPGEADPVKPTSVTKKIRKLKFGTYHALIIGNDAYDKFPKLVSAVYDAREVDKVLRERYAFQTELLINANRRDIFVALDKFRKELTEHDNFLIYFAGHGELDEKNRRGYWLPIDAVPQSRVNSIPNYAITDILNEMAVKQAIIIADTCYSGILTRSVITREQSGMSEEKRYAWLESLAKERSRTVLSSGGLKPVLDTGIGNHSVFAKALLDVLESNRDILEASRLHTKISALVSYESRDLGLEQVPQYAANLHAGHKSGDFLFVPVEAQQQTISWNNVDGGKGAHAIAG